MIFVYHCVALNIKASYLYIQTKSFSRFWLKMKNLFRHGVFECPYTQYTADIHSIKKSDRCCFEIIVMDVVI